MIDVTKFLKGVLARKDTERYWTYDGEYHYFGNLHTAIKVKTVSNKDKSLLLEMFGVLLSEPSQISKFTSSEEAAPSRVNVAKVFRATDWVKLEFTGLQIVLPDVSCLVFTDEKSYSFLSTKYLACVDYASVPAERYNTAVKFKHEDTELIISQFGNIKVNPYLKILK